MLAALALTGYGAENTITLWTFGLLFAARISAKLNLFFGVPRINTEFLPKPLAHLPSYFRQGPVTAVFPLSITLLSFATALSAQALRTATTDGTTLHFAFITTLAALALLEHWLMVLPLPDAKLWRWMLPAPKTE
jgi:putative photosynthetic complex assembly protein 2